MKGSLLASHLLPPTVGGRRRGDPSLGEQGLEVWRAKVPGQASRVHVPSFWPPRNSSLQLESPHPSQRALLDRARASFFLSVQWDGQGWCGGREVGWVKCLALWGSAPVSRMDQIPVPADLCLKPDAPLPTPWSPRLRLSSLKL